MKKAWLFSLVLFFIVVSGLTVQAAQSKRPVQPESTSAINGGALGEKINVAASAFLDERNPNTGMLRSMVQWASERDKSGGPQVFSKAGQRDAAITQMANVTGLRVNDIERAINIIHNVNKAQWTLNQWTMMLYGAVIIGNEQAGRMISQALRGELDG